LKDRIIILGTPVTDDVANSIIAQMFFLEMENPEQDIHLYINSPGGSVSAGLAIYDIMQFVKCDVSTYCIGMAASMGSLLLAAGAMGKRFVLPHARVMIHQPHIMGSGITGQVTDIEIHAKEMIATKRKLTEIYEKHTHKDFDLLYSMMERDKYMSADEAREMGIVDKVVEQRKAVKQG